VAAQEGSGSDQRPVLTAKEMIAWRAAEAARPVPRLPASALITHQGWLFRRFGDRLKRLLRRDRNPVLPAGTLLTARGRVVVAGGLGVGGPATAVVIEELAVLGVRQIIAVDIAGSLSAAVPCGASVVVEAAICGDGTSGHYTAAQRVRPCARLTEALCSALTAAGTEYRHGVVWSTDAPYRETPTEIAARRNEGAVMVDMETAALFAAASALGLDAAAVLVAADQLHDGWTPPDLKLVRRSLLPAAAAAVACLQA
jgi:uridine phosphorylase